ncbi:hypothetical protein SAMN02746009_00618 [Hymenobacter psychrotolerans DSM 18569]|uniref:Dienelactone hydrolase n=1 Tax=Hymenobacter psychrotolerans DSM 18569 TaxID=1121959 RepID=A0A1M6R719_9BACT|nr:hypothetical protein SAMN02746009_00618 [Hymenobacter psychrotolerans DSM 18569]
MLPVLAGLLGCSPDSGQQATVALPTGHYEGTVAYQGTELTASLDLREVSPGRLEADMRFPQEEGLSFAAENPRYSEPQLLLSGPDGGISVSAIREGDFLRGVFTLDSIKADFVWVRRGKAQPRAYQSKPLPAPAGTALPALTLLIPQDTLGRHPAVALFAGPATQPAARRRAAQLAGQGFVTTVVALPQVALPADSAMLQMAAQVLQALRREATVDTMRVGMWAGGNAASVVPAAVLARPKAAFVVLENVSVSSMEEARPFQMLGRQRIPVLGLYAADTSLNVKDSARRLRNAAGRQRSTQVRIFPQADARFLLPGQISPDGKWTWPASAPGYVQAISEWLK